jgi:uncharacterized protein (DUF1697 family)
MTTTWIALLRGVNVGKAKRIAMADLRATLEDLGYDDVRTILQSGNAVFTATKGKAPALETAISAKIESELKVSCKVLVRSSAELAKVVKANPFVKRKAPPGELHVTFLSKAPAAAKLAAVDAEAFAPDELELGDRVLYTRLRNGITGSKIPSWDKVLGVDASARNWRTVTRIDQVANG